MHTISPVTIFGANGRVGSQVVQLLLEKNIAVIAAIHGTHHFASHPLLEIRQVDVYDAHSIDRAIEGASAVISTLGSWGTVRKDVLSTAMPAIVKSMEAHDVTRIVSLTGADARAPGDALGIVHRGMHLFLGVIAPKILIDGERHIATLASSGADWTVLRSPVMSSSESVGNGILSMKRPMPWQRISRTYVSAAIVGCLEDDSWLKQAPYLH